MQVQKSVQLQMVALLPRLRRFALGLTGTLDRADDLVQATCERAIRVIDRFVPGTRLDSWMFKIMHNLHRNALRDRATEGRYLTGGMPEADCPLDGARAMEASLTLSATQRALETIDADQREVLMLIAVEGFSYQEAASILELPMGTVTSRLARARARLRGALDLEDGDQVVASRGVAPGA